MVLHPRASFSTLAFNWTVASIQRCQGPLLDQKQTLTQHQPYTWKGSRRMPLFCLPNEKQIGEGGVENKMWEKINFKLTKRFPKRRSLSKNMQTLKKRKGMGKVHLETRSHSVILNSWLWFPQNCMNTHPRALVLCVVGRKLALERSPSRETHGKLCQRKSSNITWHSGLRPCH